MRIFERGAGPPVVLVPGIQGRWEWMAPTVRALASCCRVITFSLADEPASGFSCDESKGFDVYVDQVEAALDSRGVATATVVGVSYGGLIAAELAARRPSRVTALVLVSTPPVDWRPDARARFYMRAPRLLSPLFCATAPARMLPEIRTAIPRRAARLRFVVAESVRIAGAFLSPARMARRVRWLEAHAFASPAAVTAPVLIVTGEPSLDRVMPTGLTLRYKSALPGAHHVVLAGTGHLGSVTRPETFAALVCDFASRVSPPADARDTIGSTRAADAAADAADDADDADGTDVRHAH